MSRRGRSYKVAFEDLPWQSPMEGMRVKELSHAGRCVRLVEYTPRMAPHWCERGHLGCVLEGRLEVRFAGDAVVFEPGDGVVIPEGPEHRHQGRALTDVVRVVFVEDV